MKRRRNTQGRRGSNTQVLERGEQHGGNWTKQTREKKAGEKKAKHTSRGSNRGETHKNMGAKFCKLVPSA